MAEIWSARASPRISRPLASVVTVVTTTLATIANIIMAHLGVI